MWHRCIAMEVMVKLKALHYNLLKPPPLDLNPAVECHRISCGKISLNRSRMEKGESKHSNTKSATARHVTNIPWTVFLVFRFWTMMSTKMFPTSPITKIVIVVIISIIHLKFSSMVTFYFVELGCCRSSVYPPKLTNNVVLFKQDDFWK